MNTPMDKYISTLIGYDFAYYYTQNLSYIYGNACIDIAYPYAIVFSPTI